MNFMRADSLPWLAEAQERIRRAAAAGRLPHSLLFLSVAGLGAPDLAAWTTAFTLCEGADSRAGAARPCGDCTSCKLLAADSHPDFHVIRVEEDSKQIKVDQVRGLIDALVLKSYRGGYKVGVIEGAEALNENGANAFLKTLEEPSQDTVLILTAKPTHRLPATVASRCLRLTLRPPAIDAAREWLGTHAGAAKNWGPALTMAAGAPLLAQELEREGGLSELDADMREGLRCVSAGAIDITLLAERWAKSDPVLRVTWLENWITARVQAALGAPAPLQTAEPVPLPDALLKPKIRALFELLDAARQFRRLASTGVNQQLALEALLQGGQAALAR
jgi:DNA polymerase-3 subunit delta'